MSLIVIKFFAVAVVVIASSFEIEDPGSNPSRVYLFIIFKAFFKFREPLWLSGKVVKMRK
jgi:hypothetical protein